MLQHEVSEGQIDALAFDRPTRRRDQPKFINGRICSTDRIDVHPNHATATAPQQAYFSPRTHRIFNTAPPAAADVEDDLRRPK
jgi:hypothetical protein